MIPTSFQTLRALRVLNIGAVGVALAGVVGIVLSIVLHDAGVHDVPTNVAGAPTLLCGLAWAWALRRPETVKKSSIRWGWVASVPLAMANSGLTFALLLMFMERFDFGKFVLYVLAGATIGALVWIPALLLTLACFGLPIASAQRLAKKGLAGEERGERIVGLACAVISAAGLLISVAGDPTPGLGTSAWLTVPRTVTLLGMILGVLSTLLASARAARRRAFVADADAGKIPGYRIDSTEEGKVLVRVVAQGKGYRVADFEEEVFELDAEGEAMRPKQRGRGG